jgi:hypothetical protein
MGQILVQRDSHDETSEPEVRFFDARHLDMRFAPAP